jgi:hypothetical protein
MMRAILKRQGMPTFAVVKRRKWRGSLETRRREVSGAPRDDEEGRGAIAWKVEREVRSSSQAHQLTDHPSEQKHQVGLLKIRMKE